jgi:hypothetical protein
VVVVALSRVLVGRRLSLSRARARILMTAVALLASTMPGLAALHTDLVPVLHTG